MQVLKVAELALILSLVSCSNDRPWTIKVNKILQTTNGSDLMIPCIFTYPLDQQVQEVYWKTKGKTSECSTNDIDKQAFVFHPNISCVLPKYKTKTTLFGSKTSGSCSLLISKVQENEEIYLRVFTNKDKYSFIKDRVFIHVNGSGIKPEVLKPVTDSSGYTTTTPVTTFSGPSSSGNDNIYLAVCVPVVALLTIVVIGIIAFIKHKRSRKVTRQESGYYVNFSRATSDPPKSEATCKKLDMEPPEEKAIDEPIYINVQAPTNQTSQSLKHTDSIYANMDYST